MMKLPSDIKNQLQRKYRNQRRHWLLNISTPELHWPCSISLSIPTEKVALQQTQRLQQWIHAWQHWNGTGELIWCTRKWGELGTHRLPEKLIFSDPLEITAWLDDSARWQRAQQRYESMINIWPLLSIQLNKHYDELADYSDDDFTRLQKLLAWLAQHPASNLYPRQLPIAGLDGKWLENHLKLITPILQAIKQDNDHDFYTLSGLKALPQLVRWRILDPALRTYISKLEDISTPWEQFAKLTLPVKSVLIVENLQTGLALANHPNTIVIMHLGYHVKKLGGIPWLQKIPCYYWGDIDTHGFSILNRLRHYLPHAKSILMDEVTLLQHQHLWGYEDTPYHATTLSLLTQDEQQLYADLKSHRWKTNLRLEQERIDWHYANAKLNQINEYQR